MHSTKGLFPPPWNFPGPRALEAVLQYQTSTVLFPDLPLSPSDRHCHTASTAMRSGCRNVSPPLDRGKRRQSRRGSSSDACPSLVNQADRPCNLQSQTLPPGLRVSHSQTATARATWRSLLSAVVALQLFTYSTHLAIASLNLTLASGCTCALGGPAELPFPRSSRLAHI